MCLMFESDICTPTSNPKTSFITEDSPQVEAGNRRFRQQAVSSKSPLVKRAKFFSGNIKEFWSAVIPGSLAPAWRGAGKA